jgi:hypothetical protein
MATNFPASLDTLTNPSATDTLDSPPHDEQHADANDAIEALQAKVGVDGSAVASSLDYKVNALETDVSTAETDITNLETDVTNINELQLNQQVGTTYTLVLADSGKLVEMNNASANTLTVPPNSSVAFPVGSQILVLQTGAGQTTVAAGAGVTVNSKDGNLKLSAQWCAATLIKRATDVWVVVGDLSA